MILLIDVGNTEIKFGLSDSKSIIEKYRIHTEKNVSSDGYYLKVKPFIEHVNIESVSISSVVPTVTQALKEMLQTYFHLTPLVIGPGVKTGVNVKTDYPQEVGADLICAVAGAKEPTEPILVIDLGTATKYIYEDHNTIKGVVITPGIEISMQALVNNAALLPDIDLEIPKKVLGTNTIACMQSGVTYGIAAQIDGLIKRIQKEVGHSFKVILTGGLSRLVLPLVENSLIEEPNLVLLGLLEITHKNINR